LWLKVAGGSKADVLVAAVCVAPLRGAILEIGTYCGYSATRMATACPGVRIVTFEVDPIHAIIAKSMFALAGLAHVVDLWIGYSQVLLQRFHLLGGEVQLRCVYMDQKGSRFVEDLQSLEKQRILLPGALVVADNVLKPGAPLFLWRLLKSGAYDTRIVGLQEFAMASEDWMSISA